MNRINLIICLVSLTTNIIVAQIANIDKKLHVIDSLIQEKNITAAQVIISNIEDNLDNYSNETKFLFLHKIASFYSDYNEDFNKASTFWFQGISLAQQSNDSKNIQIFTTGYLRVLNQYGHFRGCIDYVENNMLSIKKHFTEKTIVRVFHYLANSYNYLGFYDKGDLYIEQAISICQSNISDKEVFNDLGKIYYSRASLYYERENFVAAAEYFKKSIQIFEKDVDKNKESLAHAYCHLGETITDLKQDENEALKYKLNSARFYESLYKEDVSIMSYVYNAIGLSYFNLNDFQKADFFYDKALKADSEMEYTLKNKSILCASKGDLMNAHLYIDKVLKYFNYSAQSKLDSIKSPRRIGNFLLVKLNHIIKEYQLTNDIIYLYQANELSNRLEELALFNINRFNESENRNNFYNNAIKHLHASIDVKYLLYKVTRQKTYLEEAFEIAEMSKSLMSFETMLKQRRETINSVPATLLQKELAQKQEIASMEKELIEEASNQTELQKRLFDTQIEYEKTKKEIRGYCKDYYFNKLEIPKNTLSLAHSLVDKNSQILHYTVSDSIINVFLVNQDNIDWYRKRKSELLDNEIIEWSKIVAENPNKQTNFVESSFSFAQKGDLLFKELLSDHFTFWKQNVIIIPDSKLLTLPFEAIPIHSIEKPERFHLYDFVLRHHTISYAYSINTLTLQQKRAKDFNEFFLGIAPFYDNSTVFFDSLKTIADISRTALQPLPYSGEEVFKVASLFKGKVLIGVDAVLDSILINLKQYRILHFATHGKANLNQGLYSYLAFSPSASNKKLYAKDIGNMFLDTELVVLSACETGIGEVQQGEGVIGIAKSFVQAGAQKIVTTLWSINDEKTKEIMITFYQAYKKQEGLAQSLQKAKINYLQKHKGILAHPFFWAGFICIGE